VGTAPVTAYDTDKEFEVGILDIVPPSAAYPGGAATVQATTGSDAAATDAWKACFDALSAKVTTGVVPRLVVSVRAGGFALTGVTANAAILPVKTGYVISTTGAGGRPEPNVPFTLQYQDEDVLAAACPFESWDGTLPPPAAALACDSGCRASCEKLATVRKLRRIQGLSVSCASSNDTTKTDTCITAWQGNASTTPSPDAATPVPLPVFPRVLSPVALQFTFAIEPESAGGDTTPARGMALAIKTSNAALLQALGKGTSPFQASGMTTFDRSPADPTSGYRFLVSYPADFVLDASPGHADTNPIVIR
jgi:hypothetical protein